MKYKNIIWIIIACLTCISLLTVKFIQHEKWQSSAIHNLTEQVNSIEKDLKFANLMISKLNEKEKSNTQYIENGFNYLAIGNSITKHEKCDYWWNEIGMAATKEENDYFHLVNDFLRSKHDRFYSIAVNYSIWEINSNDRSQTFNMIDIYLSNKLDLITLQLSENAKDLSTFYSDFIELINHIKQKCPNAQIIVVDDFWSNEKSNIKKDIALACNVPFIDLSEIRGKHEYKCGMYTIVYGDDGKEYKVEHEGVANHPGDKGMNYIADKIIDQLKS